MSKTLVSPFYQFCVLLVLSVGLLILDNKTEIFQPVKTIGSIIRQPFEIVIGVQDIIPNVAQRFQDKSVLLEQNSKLEEELMVLRAKAQQYEALKQENERLSGLLSTSSPKSEELTLANIVTIQDKFLSQKLVIDRGFESGVYVGQPVVSGDGVIGQVAEVAYHRSVVMLLSHVAQGIPVQVVRNGLLTIGVGTGVPDQISLPYLELEADIRVGDQLITSGMGDRYVAGYHVGTITEVLKDTTRPFLKVSVKMPARVKYIKNVLLLWTAEDQADDIAEEVADYGE